MTRFLKNYMKNCSDTGLLTIMAASAACWYIFHILDKKNECHHCDGTGRKKK